jgi:choline dehydrogenase
LTKAATKVPLPVDAFDYIIVGAGSAGCVLANRLSANSDRRVLILEAGSRDNWIWFHIPAGYLFAIGNPRADWNYVTDPVPGLGERQLPYPRGRVIGGSSAINAMIYMRGQAADYDGWRAQGLAGWSWNDVLPFFLRHEDHEAPPNATHRTGGELRVENPRVRWALLDAIRDAAEAIGIEKIDDFNSGDNIGSAYFQVTQRRGRRWSAATAFLKPVLSRPGEIICAAGSIGSPTLLERSGIGDGKRLRSLGIDVLNERPGVGENLQDHLQLRPVFRVEGIRTLNSDYRNLLRRAMMGVDYIVRRRGPLTMAPSQVGAFVKSAPTHATANLEFHFQPLSLDKWGDGLHRFPAFTASVSNLRPTSRGSVHITAANGARAVSIRPNYLSTLADEDTAIESLKIARHIVAQHPLAPYRPEELFPGPNAQSDAELLAAAAILGTTIFHPVGTARMGKISDVHSVVDARLRVIGLDGLRVVDASIMPTITSGNTNAPTMMIAEKGAAMILEDRR